MERMIEVEIDIFDGEEYNKWIKTKDELEDESLSDSDRLVKEALYGEGQGIAKPRPTVAKFRFTPSSLIGVFETFSMDMADKEHKTLDNIMLVFNTGMEQRANMSLKQWDRLLKKFNREKFDDDDYTEGTQGI
jgi:hypothetical protein